MQQFNLYQYEKDQTFQDLNGNKINIDSKYVSFLIIRKEKIICLDIFTIKL